MATAEETESAPLGENMHADVCIVGAGIAGMSTAYFLSRAGKSLIVLDDGHIGGGMTERTTAHLSNANDDRYFEIEHLHGEKGAMLAAAFGEDLGLSMSRFEIRLFWPGHYRTGEQ